jgi:hypothetical protein
MSEFQTTSQYTVKFKGQSSRPYVQEPPIVNKENSNYADLNLAGPAFFSDNIEDYEAYHEGVKLKVIKIKGNVLTVQAE